MSELRRGLVRPLCHGVSVGRNVENALESGVADNVREDADTSR
jgi:hypothetical protein